MIAVFFTANCGDVFAVRDLSFINTGDPAYILAAAYSAVRTAGYKRKILRSNAADRFTSAYSPVHIEV